MIEKYNDRLFRFWSCRPGLFYGISSLLGFYASFYGVVFVLFPMSCLWSPYLITPRRSGSLRSLSLSLLLFISCIVYAESYRNHPSLPPEGVIGEGFIDIESVSLKSGAFGKTWVYRCRLLSFHPEGKKKLSIARNCTCSIFLSHKPRLLRPPADCSYLVKGRLMSTGEHTYYIKIDKEKPWRPLQSGLCLAEFRFRMKQALTDRFEKIFSYPRSAVFLAGMATGEFDDRIMQTEFARFGLGHILAISGFHFAITAGVLSLIVRPLLPSSIATICICLFLTAYYIFLGNSASVLRSWIMILIGLLGNVFGKKGSALNSLGIALLIILLLDPLLSLTIGFQLSFLATAAILFCYAPIDRALEYLLPKRPLSQMINMNYLNRHGYCLLSFFRQGAALGLAVHLFVFPVVLYYFHVFSWTGIFYNFFFPLLVSLSIFLLLVGLLFSLVVPFLAWPIHACNNFYTNRVLNVIYNLPLSIDANFETENLSPWFVVCYLCILFLCGIFLKTSLIEDHLERQDPAFI